MRYYVMFGITFLICLYLVLFDPFQKYLGIYINDMIIEYDQREEGYHWEYDSNNILDIKKIDDSKWKLSVDKNGNEKLVFYYVNDNNPKDIKYTINYEFDVKFNKIFWTVGESVGLTDFPNPY